MRVKEIIKEVSKVLKGKEEQIERALVCFLSGGHLLIEDIPGVGKTTLAVSLARVMDLSFSRIQFTSDLMPSDITGTSVFDKAKGEFIFKKGPIFNNLVLADEINRATPKTQSALLEAMAEKQVTVDGKTYKLEEPFFVIATQNPIEHYGTYPLPESQLDRFTMCISLGYPEAEVEKEIIKGVNPLERVESLKVIVKKKDILRFMEEVKRIFVSEEVAEFVINVANEIRDDPRVVLGVSTRGLIHLVSSAKALAFVRERDFVVPEDVIENLSFVISHRIVVREGDPEEVIRDALSRVRVPR